MNRIRTIVITIACAAVSAAAQPLQKIVPEPRDRPDSFGGAVAMSGNRMIVGDRRADFSIGRAHIYRRSGAEWMLEATLKPSDPGNAYAFGSSVDIEGGTAIVGAELSSGEFEAEGAAYVFELSGAGWVEQARLASPTPSRIGLFGNAVALSGARVAVGAWFEAMGEGAAHVFVRKGGEWVHEARFAEQELSFYGAALDLKGTELVVGAALVEPSGAAYVYERRGDAWGRRQQLVPDLTEHAEFGLSTVFSGSHLFIGAGTQDGPAERTGAVHVYERRGRNWKYRQTISPSDGGRTDYFGYAVAAHGGKLLVGARWQGDGAAYLYESVSGGWEETAKLTPDPHEARNFGAAVAMHGGWIGIGAGSTAPSGAVFVGRAGSPADVNADGRVDVFDVLEFQALYATEDDRADLDGDGAVGISDLLMLIGALDR